MSGFLKHMLNELEVSLSSGHPITKTGEKESNPTDVIKAEVSLFIRLLEFAHENAKTDQELHEITERAVKLCASGRILQMNDYQSLVSNLATGVSDDPNKRD